MSKNLRRMIALLLTLLIALSLCVAVAEEAATPELTVSFKKETPKAPYEFIYATRNKADDTLTVKLKPADGIEITEYVLSATKEDGSATLELGSTSETEYTFSAEGLHSGHWLLNVSASTADGRTVTAQRLFTTQVTWLESLVVDFNLNFLDENRWEMIVTGLGNTMIITLLALLLGTVIGSILAMVCSTWDKTADTARKTVGRRIFGIANGFCRVYLTVFRGTPVVVQLMIIYFVILASARNGVLVAALAFGLNSGAYIAEIIRGGIMSIDNGQFEAGRSLGFNYVQTMRFIVLPQTIKNVLPALANEFIALLKETSVAGYVGVMDLSKSAELIRGRTYSAFMPLIAIALIYLILVLFFTRMVGILERRLRSSDH